MLTTTNDEELRRNERLLNLKELDLEIKQRELDLALHLKDLEERESALLARKNAIAAELRHELALELERVRIHEESIKARHNALEFHVDKREKALAKRELVLSEREWTLRAKEDDPKGVMAQVFSALEPESPVFRCSQASTLARDATTASTLDEGTQAAETRTRVNSAKRERGEILNPAGVDFEQVTQSTDKSRSLVTRGVQQDLADLINKADDLRGHLSAIRLSAELNHVTMLVDEAVHDVIELHARNARGAFEQECLVNQAQVQFGASAERLLTKVADNRPETNVHQIAFAAVDHRVTKSNSKSIHNIMSSGDPAIRALQLEAQSERLKERIRDFENGRILTDDH